jgi:hypothetical protein
MVESLVYGNPSQSQLKWLEKEGVFYKFFEQLTKFKFPQNGSRVTINELNEVLEYVNETKDDSERLTTYRIYDQSVAATYKRNIKALDLQEEEKDENQLNIVINDVFEDINYLIYNLKYYFQRPRPYQLAKFYNQSLFPIDSYTSNSPSYPSAHAIQADILSYIFGNWYPKHYPFFLDLSAEIGKSRLYMGLNYQSDLDFSYFISEMIKTDKSFLSKYYL